MARLPRKVLPEQAIFQITARGAGRIAIFLDDDDRRFFLFLLGVAAARFDWTVHAFCLMDNHYHLVVEARRDDLSAGLHMLNGTYAQRFNARHRRWGHLFGERFAAWVVRSEEHFAATCRYVLQNPVRAGLTHEVGAWPWAAIRKELAP